MAACPPAAPRAAEYAPPLALVEGLAGALGGVLGLALTHPLVVVSTRLQLQSRRDASPSVAAASSPPAPALAQPPARLPDGVLAAVLHLARAEGVGSLYRGLASGCASLFVSNALYHALYAALRDAWLRFVARRRKAVVEKAIGGAAALPVSAAAAALSVLLTAPLWTVTTRLQATKASLRAVLRDVYASGGLPAFWTGTWASLALVANPVVQFGCYEALLTRAPAAGLSPTDSRTVFAAAALAKLAATLATYPYLVVKTKQQAGAGKGVGALRTLLDVAKADGLSGLYTGFGSKAAQTVLAAAILFSSKEAVTRHVAAALAAGARRRGNARAKQL